MAISHCFFHDVPVYEDYHFAVYFGGLGGTDIRFLLRASDLHYQNIQEHSIYSAA